MCNDVGWLIMADKLAQAAARQLHLAVTRCEYFGNYVRTSWCGKTFFEFAIDRFQLSKNTMS